jgi:hypothetical protein
VRESRAEITLEYGSERIAAAVVDAVSPDNLRTPGFLSVRTRKEAERVITRIECRGKLLTLAATIDDLLSHAAAAEKAVNAAMALK